MRCPSTFAFSQVHKAVGGTGVIDDGALGRILDQAKTVALHVAAASMLVGLLRDRPFSDCNAEAALVAVTLFYDENSWELASDAGEQLAELIEAVVSGGHEPGHVAAALAELARPVPSRP